MKYLEKVLSSGLYLLAFILPLQTRLFIRPGILNGGYFEYGTISLYGTDVLLISTICFYLFYLWQKYKAQNIPPQRDHAKAVAKIQSSEHPATAGPRQGGGKSQTNKLYLLIIGLNLLSLVSIFFAADKLVAAQAYMRLTLGMGLFWLVVSAQYDKLKLLYAFLAGAVAEASFGIWQFLSQTTFASSWLGLAAHPAEIGGSSVIETLADGRWLRAYGGLDHPNVLGGLLAVSSLLIIYLMLRNEAKSKTTNPPAGEAGYELPVTNKIPASPAGRQNFIFYFLFFTFLTALFFTFSRGAWAAFIAGAIIIFVFSLRQGNKNELRQLIVLGTASAVLAGVLFFSYHNLVATRLSGGARLEIKSNQERTDSYKDGIAIIKDHWLTGVGIGGYTKSLYELYPNEPGWSYQPTHNVFLLVWAELGIIGLILFVAILVYILIFNFSRPSGTTPRRWQFFPPQRDHAKAVAIFNLSILLTLIILMLPDHHLWSLHFGVLFFWLLLGLAVKEEPRTA